MIPRCFPTNSSGYWRVYEVSPAGLTKWVDYIPVEDKTGTAASPNVYDDGDGWYKAEVLLSVAGLTAWVDYTPVDLVASTAEGRSDDGGAIPIWTP